MNKKRFLFFILFLLVLIYCGVIDTPSVFGKETTRKPTVAGTFYSSSKSELQNDIKKYLSLAKASKIQGKPFVFFVPHAGYVYSGKTAAYSYKALEKHKNVDTYIILGLSHRYPIDKASFSNDDFYKTPLGKIAVNKKIIKKLNESNLFQNVNQAHKNEHSIEVQVPFIQTINPNSKIVPILINRGSYEYLEQVAVFLSEFVKKENVMLVVSTDMSHYHNKKEANRIDNYTLELILNMNTRSLYNEILKEKCELCGSSGTLVGLITAKKLGAEKIKLLEYTDSSRTSGDTTYVVGYFSGAAYKPPKLVPESNRVSLLSKTDRKSIKKGLNKKQSIKKSDLVSNNTEEKFMLTKQEEESLLNIARTSILKKINKEPIPEFPIDKNSILNKKLGAFVTLKKHGNLRGCIGYIQGVKPLNETISEMALNAGFKDPRFSPLSKDEYDEIEIEISVLSELVKTDDISKIEVGKHGIYMQKGFRSGLLLPQVATEHDWNRDTFLAHTCRKAGLPEDAWKDEDTDIFIFSAYIFGEK